MVKVFICFFIFMVLFAGIVFAAPVDEDIVAEQLMAAMREIKEELAALRQELKDKQFYSALNQ